MWNKRGNIGEIVTYLGGHTSTLSCTTQIVTTAFTYTVLHSQVAISRFELCMKRISTNPRTKKSVIPIIDQLKVKPVRPSEPRPMKTTTLTFLLLRTSMACSRLQTGWRITPWIAPAWATCTMNMEQPGVCPQETIKTIKRVHMVLSARDFCEFRPMHTVMRGPSPFTR